MPNITQATMRAEVAQAAAQAAWKAQSEATAAFGANSNCFHDLTPEDPVRAMVLPSGKVAVAYLKSELDTFTALRVVEPGFCDEQGRTRVKHETESLGLPVGEVPRIP